MILIRTSYHTRIQSLQNVNCLRLPEVSISILSSTVAVQCKLIKLGFRHHIFVARTLDEVVKRSDNLVSGRDLSLK